MDQEKHVIEYTSGQLIFAICIALMVALLCFLLGMFVKPSAQSQLSAPPPAKDTPAANAPAPKSASPAIAKEAGNRKEGQQTSPKPSVLSNVRPAPPKTAPTAPVPAPAMETPKPSGGAPAATAPAPPGTPGQPEKTKATESPKKEVASRPPDKAQSPLGTEAEGATDPKVSEKGAAPSATAKAPTDGQARAAATGFTVQLAAFSPAELAKAEDYRTRLDKNTDLKPEIMRSKDGKFVRVVTGAYPDRATAEKAREVIAKRAEFAKCFVRLRE